MMSPSSNKLKISALSLVLFAGLSFGFPEVQAQSIKYVIPIGGAGGNALGGSSAEPKLPIEMSLAAGALSNAYTEQAYDFDLNSFLSIQGDPGYDPSLVTWSISPELPAGMSFEGGVLGGVPTDLLESTGFMVSASYKGGSAEQVYQLEIGLAGWMHANGVTVICAGTPDGVEFELEGKTYRVVYSKADAKKHAAQACTSNMTLMNMMSFGSAFNEGISHWDTSNVTNMYQMFSYANVFDQDIGAWDVSKVKNMNEMFRSAITFDQDIGGWDTGSVTNLSRMFFEARAFNKDIGDWDTSSVTDMSNTFFNAHSFDQDIGRWSTSNVTSMTNMLRGASNFNQDLSAWCVTKVPVQNRLDFDTGTPAWVKTNRQPIWGTCPAG